MQKHKLKRHRQSDSVGKNRGKTSPRTSPRAKIDQNVYIFENDISQNELRTLLEKSNIKTLDHQSMVLDGNSIDGQYVDKITSLGIAITQTEKQRQVQVNQLKEQVERDR